MQKISSLPLLVLVASSLLFSGCSSVPKPIGEIASAKTLIESAETNEAGKYAPVALDRAKTKLKRAQKAMIEEEYLEAKQLADEAQADAKLASVKANSARSEDAAKKMNDTVKGMAQELERK